MGKWLQLVVIQTSRMTDLGSSQSILTESTVKFNYSK